jgi:hypothetical protein
MVDQDGHLIKFKPVKEVKAIQLLSASFGRTMAEYAEAEGVRYQFDGPTDIKTNISWSGDDWETKLRV